MRRFIPLLVLGIIAAMWLGAPTTYMEISAPDGTGERLTARSARFRGLLGVLPGQGGDHPGVLELRGPLGQVCGRMAVPMVNLIADARWEAEEVRLVAVGGIRRCVIRQGAR